MTMMTCPKCGFEQPHDQFCAKCGVNVESFRPAVGLGSGLSYLLKPVIFVAIILGVIFLLFKSVENRIVAPEIPIEESTQIGSGASSLKTNRAYKESMPETETEDLTPRPATRGVKIVPAENTLIASKKSDASIVKFNQITVNFSLAEHGLEESTGKSWFLVSQASPIFSSAAEEVILKTGNNTFVFEDELIVYDLNFFVEEITEKDIKLKINIKRTLRARAEGGSQNHSFSLNEKVPLDQTLIIIDALPRRASIDRPNSLLSTLYKSESFLSHASELVQIIKFENPSNSPQE